MTYIWIREFGVLILHGASPPLSRARDSGFAMEAIHDASLSTTTRQVARGYWNNQRRPGEPIIDDGWIPSFRLVPRTRSLQCQLRTWGIHGRCLYKYRQMSMVFVWRPNRDTRSSRGPDMMSDQSSLFYCMSLLSSIPLSCPETPLPSHLFSSPPLL
jgi:hypothetical protein